MLEERYQQALEDLNLTEDYKRISTSGYAVRMWNEHSFKKSINIHRFIASSVFRKELNQMDEVHHLDKNALNNHYTNLMILNSYKHHILHSFCDKHPEYYGLSQCETMKILEYANEFVDCLNGDIQHDLNVYKSRIEKRKKTGSFSRLQKMEELLKKIKDRRRVELGRENGKLARVGSRKPSKEKLIDILEKNMNMVNSAYELGVTPNTVRKWCKQYNIDFKNYLASDQRQVDCICPTCGKVFKRRIRSTQKYCCLKCSRRKVTFDIDELEACALSFVFKKSFREIGRIFNRDHEVMSRLIRRTELEWNALSNEKKLEVIERVSDKYLK